MRVYLTTTIGRTETSFRDGFSDWYKAFGMRGVYFATKPLGANDGFEGDGTVCLEVPLDTFEKYPFTVRG
jgi:hypothetical protein